MGWKKYWFRMVFFCKRKTHYWMFNHNPPWGEPHYYCKWCEKSLTIKEYRGAGKHSPNRSMTDEN